MAGCSTVTPMAKAVSVITINSTSLTANGIEILTCGNNEDIVGKAVGFLVRLTVSKVPSLAFSLKVPWNAYGNAYLDTFAIPAKSIGSYDIYVLVSGGLNYELNQTISVGTAYV